MTKRLTNSAGVLFRYSQQQFLNRLTDPDEEGPVDPDDPSISDDDENGGGGAPPPGGGTGGNT